MEVVIACELAITMRLCVWLLSRFRSLASRRRPAAISAISRHLSPDRGFERDRFARPVEQFGAKLILDHPHAT